MRSKTSGQTPPACTGKSTVGLSEEKDRKGGQRVRREKLTDLLALGHVTGASQSERRFHNFVAVHGRHPNAAEAKALALGDEDPFPPFYECQPRLYLEAVADGLRPLAELHSLRRPAPESVVSFGKQIDSARKRSKARGRASLPAKDVLRCALLALGLPSRTANDWLKRVPVTKGRHLPDDEAAVERLAHLGTFIEECCWLAFGHEEAKHHRVESAALYAEYASWCSKDPTPLRGHEPFTKREFSLEVIKCGSVKLCRTARWRGFCGIELRRP